MTNLLEHWQQKPSWQMCYTPVPAYMSRRTGFTDLSLRNILSNELSWTYDVKEPSGFAEIECIPAVFPGERFSQEVNVKDNITDICWDLLHILQDTIMKMWNPQMPHVCYISGGRDSRILLWILRNLLREGFDLGEFIIISHEPEQDQFRAAMKEMEFPHEYWVIQKEDGLTAPDYYEVPHVSRDCNGFVGPQLTMNQHYFPEQESCLVTGGFGGELVDYPVYRKQRSTFGQFLNYATFPRTHLCELYTNWGDLLMPYTSYDYMNYIFHIPQKFFVATGHVMMSGGDLLRDTMLKHLGNTAPFYYRHNYNTDLTEATKLRIQSEYLNSNFVRYFSHLEGILTARPANNIFSKWNIESKLYGLASVFEGLPENKAETVEVKQEWAFEREKLIVETFEAERIERVKQWREHDAKNPPNNEHHYSD